MTSGPKDRTPGLPGSDKKKLGNDKYLQIHCPQTFEVQSDINWYIQYNIDWYSLILILNFSQCVLWLLCYMDWLYASPLPPLDQSSGNHQSCLPPMSNLSWKGPSSSNIEKKGLCVSIGVSTSHVVLEAMVHDFVWNDYELDTKTSKSIKYFLTILHISKFRTVWTWIGRGIVVGETILKPRWAGHQVGHNL